MKYSRDESVPSSQLFHRIIDTRKSIFSQILWSCNSFPYYLGGGWGVWRRIMRMDWLSPSRLENCVTFVIILLVAEFFGQILLTGLLSIQVQSIQHGQGLLSVPVLGNNENKWSLKWISFTENKTLTSPMEKTSSFYAEKSLSKLDNCILLLNGNFFDWLGLCFRWSFSFIFCLWCVPRPSLGPLKKWP